MDKLATIRIEAEKARQVVRLAFEALMRRIDAAEIAAIAEVELQAELSRIDIPDESAKVNVLRDDGGMIEFAVGQRWTKGSGIWETGKRILAIQQRQSVTFLKTTGLRGGEQIWESTGLMIAWIDDTGSKLKSP